jgi:AcrR family transcriptional regulator
MCYHDFDMDPRHRILDAAEAALRRFGTEKTNVVDIARALEMSHANIYRFFPNKKALLQAVADRWLELLMAPLDAIATDESRTAATRLADWLEKIRAAKRKKLQDDPEIFRIHFNIISDLPDTLSAHLSHMQGQVENIISDGIAGGEFASGMDATTVARAFLQATMPFHHPALIMQGPAPTKADAEALVGLVLDGLRRRPRR